MSISRKELFAVGFVAAANFFVLVGYELIRTSSTVLFKQAYGAHNLPVIMALMPLGVLLGLSVYGRLISWLGPRRTLMVTTLGSGIAFIVCYSALRGGFSWVTGILYIIREFYIVLLIEQYWSFINSSITEDTAKKVNGPILGIAAIAGAMGGFLVFGLAELVGTVNLLLLAAGLLLPAAFLSDMAYRKAGEPKATQKDKKEQQGHLGLHQFKLHPLLIFILGIVITAQIISTLTGLRFQEMLSEQFLSIDEEAAFQGRFYGSLQLFVLVIQFVITPILLTKLRLRSIHLAIPCIHIATCCLAIFYPSLATVGLSYFLFKAFDYSVFRAAKEIFYIPLSFNVRYRAKEFIDVFGYRLTKGATSGLVAVSKKAGAFLGNSYLIGALLAAVTWFILVFPLLKEINKEKPAKQTY